MTSPESQLHRSLAICHHCGKVIPHDALACPCGAVAARPWAQYRPDTPAAELLRALAGLAEGIGWYGADAGNIAIARRAHISLFIEHTRAATSMEVMDDAAGSVYQATMRCTMDQAKYHLAQASMAHVRCTYGPEYRPHQQSIHPDRGALARKLAQLGAIGDARKWIPNHQVAQMLTAYRQGRGASIANRFRTKAPRPVPDRDRTTPLRNGSVPWSRMNLDDCCTMDLGDVPKNQHRMEVARLRALRDTWIRARPERRKCLFRIWHQEGTLYIMRTA